MKVTTSFVLAGTLKEFLAENQGDHRCARLLLRGFYRIRATVKGSWLINPSLPGHHFAFREKKGMISFTPNGKELQYSSFGEWSLSGRQAMSPGRWMKAMLNPRVVRLLKIGDHEFGAFATALKAEEEKGALVFKFVGFADGYNRDKYTRDTKIPSCMWNHPVGEFYSLFDAKCLVCMTKAGQYRGRAVVWSGVQSEMGEITFMDRVYTDSEEVKNSMFDYAKSQGWWRKYRQSYDSQRDVVGPNGATRAGVCMSVTARQEVVAEFYPYMDTFTYGDDDGLSNNSYGGMKYVYHGANGDSGTRTGDTILDVDGEPIPEGREVRVNGSYYDREDERLVYSDGEGGYLLMENAECVEGEWYPADSDRIVYSEPQGEFILCRKAIRIGDDVYSESGGLVVRGRHGAWLLKEDAVRVLGYWYDKDDNRVVVDMFGNYNLNANPVVEEDEEVAS